MKGVEVYLLDRCPLKVLLLALYARGGWSHLSSMPSTPVKKLSSWLLVFPTHCSYLKLDCPLSRVIFVRTSSSKSCALASRQYLCLAQTICSSYNLHLTTACSTLLSHLSSKQTTGPPSVRACCPGLVTSRTHQAQPRSSLPDSSKHHGCTSIICLELHLNSNINIETMLDFCKSISCFDFLDGGPILFNNPSMIAVEEATPLVNLEFCKVDFTPRALS